MKEESKTDLGNVPQVEEVVDFGGGGEEFLDHRLVHFNGGLCHDVSDRLHLLLKVLQFLIDHAAKDSLDLSFLKWNKGHINVPASLFYNVPNVAI